MREAMRLIDKETLNDWILHAPPYAPSEILQGHLRRVEIFDLESSWAAKMVRIDALFAEIVNLHSRLKVWKGQLLETDTLTSVADYLVAPRRAYLKTPLLCAVEAKRDEFEPGRVQCIAEMAACQWNNRRDGLDLDIYGIVSNGQGWRFYKLTKDSEAYETTHYGIKDLPGLLGALEYVCAECEKNVP